MFELRSLERRINGIAISRPPELVSITYKQAVWRIYCDSVKSQYMRSIFPNHAEGIYVVFVDSKLFYKCWLKSSLAIKSNQRFSFCHLLKDMPTDRKFNRAESGFSFGINNPVPLALISAGCVAGNECIAFTNGVTRTKWLLANGAKSFPVEVSNQAMALYLHNLCGTVQVPISIEQLKQHHNANHPYHCDMAPSI